MWYTNPEYYEMILCVGAAEGNLRGARRLYAARFIDGRPVEERRRLPSLKCFRKMTMRLQRPASFHGPHHEGRPAMRDPNVEFATLEHFEMNPKDSTRRAGGVLGVRHTLVWRVLKEDGQHPYHGRLTQELTATDYQYHVIFCEMYRDEMTASPNFGARVLWTDEASFTRGGISNVHNEHVWGHMITRMCSLRPGSNISGASMFGLELLVIF